MTFSPVQPWVAAAARTQPLRTVNGARAALAWPTKDPNETLDYSLYVAQSDMDAVDALASVSVVTFPTDLTASNGSVNAATCTATVWLSGGTALQTYALTWTVITASGRQIIATGGLLVSSAVSGSTGATPVYTPASLAAAIAVLPTSPAGLAVGAIWNDGGTIKQVQA